MPHDLRDTVVDFIKDWAEKTQISKSQLLRWASLNEGKFYAWVERYGKANEHNGKIPRDFWLEDWEKEAILRFHSENPLEGYRRLAFMMIDCNLVCVSPSSVYRVLKDAGVIDKRNSKTSLKGTGFVPPRRPHEHWHVDVSYLNISGTFYYLASVLDGYSRAIVSWELRECMKEGDLELVIQKAREKYPGETPRIISDRGPQFVSRDFKEYIRICGMTHVLTSPYYPQSNGKIERYHRTMKEKTVRRNCPETIEEALLQMTSFVEDYNTKRLHSGIGYVTPADMLAGRAEEIQKIRDDRLEKARALRAVKRERKENQFS